MKFSLCAVGMNATLFPSCEFNNSKQGFPRKRKERDNSEPIVHSLHRRALIYTYDSERIIVAEVFIRRLYRTLLGRKTSRSPLYCGGNYCFR